MAEPLPTDLSPQRKTYNYFFGIFNEPVVDVFNEPLPPTVVERGGVSWELRYRMLAASAMQGVNGVPMPEDSVVVLARRQRTPDTPVVVAFFLADLRDRQPYQTYVFGPDHGVSVPSPQARHALREHQFVGVAAVVRQGVPLPLATGAPPYMLENAAIA